ncbi:hypothetical protein JW977_03420 [Candidatus Falkowbacteria bacterium]|nr:hypothetical protein [Candidatus Falkowbacteria bacterium]
MRKLFVGLMVMCLLTLISAETKHEQEINSKKVGIKLVTPVDWTYDENKCDPLLSLYSPETKEHPHKTLDLEKGLKMELALGLNETRFMEAMKGVKAEKFTTLVNIKDKDFTAIYLEKGTYGSGREMLCLHALLKNKEKSVWVIGYIPEKEKLNEYAEKYTLILASIEFLKQTKSDSK